MLLYQILAYTVYGKIQKIKTKTIELKFHLQSGKINLNYLMGHNLYRIFMIILSISAKKYEAVTENPPVRIYVIKIENRMIFRIKTGYYLDLLKHEPIKLLGSTKNQITKDKNSENVPHLEINEVVLVYSNIASNDYQHYSRVLHIFFLINCQVSCQIFHLKTLYF